MATLGEAPRPGSAATPAPGRARRWRWLLALGLGPLLVASVLALGVVVLGHNLDRPWLKARLLASLRERAGLDVDYAGLDVSLRRGVRAASLRVLTPASLAAGGEVFLSIEDLALEAPLWSLAFREPRVARLHVGVIDVTLVRDESGRSTLSELFPAGPEPEPSPATPLSLTLADLPRASLDRLEIGALRARQVELRSALPPRVLELGSVGVSGALHAGAPGLAGSQLQARGAPALRLELREGEQVRRAELELAFEASAADAESLALELRLALHDQDLAPGWPRSAELLALRAALRFAPVPGSTSLDLIELRALGHAVSASGRARVFDAGPLRVTSSGSAAVHLGSWPPDGLPRAALPPPLGALSFGAFDLDVAARQLSWDEESGVHGALRWRAVLAELGYDDGSIRASSSALTLSGDGAFEGREGRFQARLSASGAGRTPELGAELEGLALELRGTTTRDAAAQRVNAEAKVALDAARLRTARGEALALSGARLESQLSGTLEQLAQRALSALDARLTLGQLEASGAGQRARLDALALGASLRELAPDAASASGFAGSAELSLELGAASAFERPRGARGERRTLTLRDLRGRLALPLSLAQADAELGVGGVSAPPASLSGLELELNATQPLGWAPGSAGAARATLQGALDRVSVGASRGALRALRVSAERDDGDRYRLQLGATLGSLLGRGQALPGPLEATLTADATLGAGTLQSQAALRGGKAAPRLDAALRARFARATERVAYDAQVTGTRLESLARLLLAAAPDTEPLSLVANRIHAWARGELAGVLHAGPGPLPVPDEAPTQHLRGRQAFGLELDGVEYRAPDGSLSVPSAAFSIESEHRARGAGSAQARLGMSALSYEGKGRALRFEGFDQTLAASFDRTPSQGVTTLKSTLALSSATQSWLPGYPIRDLRCTTDLKLDRQLSVSLRELTFDNPGGGTRLAASGDLELRAEGSPSITGAQTLVGREALSFDGRFEQQFEPLERAGATARSSGSVTLPFRVESGGLLGYRLLATLQAENLFFATHDRSLEIRRLNGVIPIVEEIALLPGGMVMGSNPRGSPLSDARFFDVHPFLAGDNYLTADSIRAGTLPALGPLAANVRLERTGLLIDQLQFGYSGGQVVGQARIAYREGNPVLRLRLNATGLRSARSDELFDANATLSFEPVALTLGGKLQIVRASSAHVLDMLDVIDPYRESTNANRVRSALALGYPKFVRFKLHDGTVDAKVELGGLAQLVRLDEIKAIPLGPVLQRYVAPRFEGLLPPKPPPTPPPASSTQPAAAAEPSAPAKTATREP